MMESAEVVNLIKPAVFKVLLVALSFPIHSHFHEGDIRIFYITQHW